MTEDDFLEEQEQMIYKKTLPIVAIITEPDPIIATNVYWVQLKYGWDRKVFYNQIRRLGAKYMLGSTGSQDYTIAAAIRMPYSFLTEDQYFMFKLMGIEHNVYYFEVLTKDSQYHASLIFLGVY